MPGKPPRTRKPVTTANANDKSARTPRVTPDPDPPPPAKLPVYRRFLNQVLLGTSSRIMMLVGLFLLCFSAVFLFVAWQSGPQALADAARYRAYTARVDAPVIESWMALEVNPARIRNPEFWRSSAMASECAVVEYGGDWGPPIRRAFCGNRFEFHDSYPVHTAATMAPNVPFAWARDGHGFIVPEIRLDPKALEWLSTAEANTFMHRQWPAKSALDWLRLELDRPIESAVIGWTAKPALLPLSYDPQHPDGALPAGIVQARREREPFWFVTVLFAAMGLPIWMAGMKCMPFVSGMAVWPQRIVSVLLVGTVPWWGDYFPRAVTHFSSQAGDIVGMMFGDMTRHDRMVASEPADATQASGARITWRVGDSVYADTLGVFRLAPPLATPADLDAALAALTAGITAQVHALDDAGRQALFERLERDKLRDLRAVGIAFVPAAREALIDPNTDPAVRRAARRFLTAWVTAPSEIVDKHTPAWGEWGRIQRSLADVPVPEIANMVGGPAR